MILPAIQGVRRLFQRFVKFNDPPDYTFQPVADDLMIFNFKSKDDIKEWDVLSDADLGGKSAAQFTTTSAGKAVFYGRTVMECPKGLIYSGFASVRMRERRHWAFFHNSESETMDWNPYQGLEIRLRGDGRKYIFNLQMEFIRRMSPDATWQFPIYTRGGPEWEIYRMPFTKFIETGEGYVQPQQKKINLGEIKSMGIILKDRMDGPFRLEIDYIKAITLLTHEVYHPDDFRPPRSTSMTTNPKI